MDLRAGFHSTIRAANLFAAGRLPACRRPLRARAPEISMTKRMLIDASHPEETRVVVLDGSKVEEFDFEAASKRPLKGNIYLAKVTRVEPSLQAAFVEYGGNRQGFLAFAEIHPDYYQIPIADRQALLAEQEAEARRRQEDDIESFEITGARSEDGEAEDGEAEEEAEEEADSGDEVAEMAPLVPLDAAPEARTPPRTRPTAAGRRPRRRLRQSWRRADEYRRIRRMTMTTTTTAGSKAGRRGHERWPTIRAMREVAAAEAAEENEGEIEPVSVADVAERCADTPAPRPRRSAERPRWRQPARRRTGAEAAGEAQALQAAAPVAALGAPQALQDPGSDQAPPDHPGAGGQGRTRQQGRRADDLSVAGRPLLRADAQHAARRRHLPQDHQCRRPQAAEIAPPRGWNCPKAWA